MLATKSQLPFIAGNILKNEAVSAATLKRANSWLEQFPTLHQAQREKRVNIFQISDHSDKNDPGGPHKASLLTLNTSLAGRISVPAFLVLHYRGTDPWNRKFQTDQARRLADHVGFEFLRDVSRGVYISVHHECDGIPETLEIGDHRLVARFNEYRYTRSFFSTSEPNPEIQGLDETPMSAMFFPDLLADSAGVFKLGGTAVRPLGELPWSTLALSLETSAESRSEETKELIDAALTVYGKRHARVFYDSKNNTSLNSGKQGVSLTLVPKGLTSEEQVEIVTSMYAFHLPFLPWHEGKLIVKDGAF